MRIAPLKRTANMANRCTYITPFSHPPTRFWGLGSFSKKDYGTRYVQDKNRNDLESYLNIKLLLFYRL